MTIQLAIFGCDCGDHAFANTPTQAGTILVSPEDRSLLETNGWGAMPRRRTLYAVHVFEKGKTPVRLHQLIAGKGSDHKNRNGLDNRRSNLRRRDASANGQNRAPKKGKRFLGVWAVGADRFVAAICKDYKVQYLGSHTSEEDAARTYDSHALKLYGPEAYLNFPKISP